MRGPGEYFGKKQSGLPEFKVANIVNDELVLEAARYEATDLLMEETFLKNEAYHNLRVSAGIEDGQINDILD